MNVDDAAPLVVSRVMRQSSTMVKKLKPLPLRERDLLVDATPAQLAQR